MLANKILSSWRVRARNIRRITTGIFNETYLVSAGGKEFILQKLHPLISGVGPIKNYAAITSFLRKKGFPAQEIVPSADGKLLVVRGLPAQAGGESWRLMKPVAGRVYEKAESAVIAKEAGKMLGRMHKALSGFEGTLSKTLPMFRYGGVFSKLKRHKKNLRFAKDKSASMSAHFLAEMMPKHFLPAGLPKKIIHTDPKISNFVFNNRGQAISMIDWDTAQVLSPLYDIGDAIRSICGEREDNRQNKFDKIKYKKFLEGYFATSGRYLNAKEKSLIGQATGLIMLGLATRFLNDYVDDFYFGWNNKRYKTRKAHNLARAAGQIALYKDFAGKVLFK